MAIERLDPIVADLARVTCEEFYEDPDMAYDEQRIALAEERAAREAEPECVACGGYGYLGVSDELCDCGQSRSETDFEIGTRARTNSVRVSTCDEDIPF